MHYNTAHFPIGVKWRQIAAAASHHPDSSHLVGSEQFPGNANLKPKRGY